MSPMNLKKRLDALEHSDRRPRMIVAKLCADADLDALLAAQGITRGVDDLVVRISKPDGCDRPDFARVVA